MIDINELIKISMKEKNTEVLNVLKLVKAEFLKKSTEPNRESRELTEVEQMKVLMNMASQRKDSIKQYTQGGRTDLAEAEQKELDIINGFLPKEPTEEEIIAETNKVIDKFIEQNDADWKISMKEMKAVLTIVQIKYPTANGKVVSMVLNKRIKEG